MQGRERQRGFGLQSGGPQYPQLRSAGCEVVEERRLAHPGLAADQDGRCPTFVRSLEHPGELSPLRVTTMQHPASVGLRGDRNPRPGFADDQAHHRLAVVRMDDWNGETRPMCRAEPRAETLG